MKTLGEWIEERRQALGLSQNQAAATAGISVAKWGSIERGDPAQLRWQTKSAITAALQWTPQSIDAILAGNAPTIIEPTNSGPVELAARIAALPPEERLFIEAALAMAESRRR